MPFTEFDCVKECLLNVMIADAWAEERSGKTEKGLSEEHLTIIQSWMERLKVEGPERDRLLSLTTHPVDPFQAQVFRNELRTTLSRDSCRSKLGPVKEALDNQPAELHPLEKKFSQSVRKALNENSCIEQHIRQALGR